METKDKCCSVVGTLLSVDLRELLTVASTRELVLVTDVNRNAHWSSLNLNLSSSLTGTSAENTALVSLSGRHMHAQHTLHHLPVVIFIDTGNEYKDLERGQK